MGSAKNDFLRKRDERDQKFLDAGEQMGVQKMWDYVQQALRETEVVGPVIFGRKRLEKLYKRVSELADHYHPAFTKDREADNRQEELDTTQHFFLTCSWLIVSSKLSNSLSTEPCSIRTVSPA